VRRPLRVVLQVQKQRACAVPEIVVWDLLRAEALRDVTDELEHRVWALRLPDVDAAVVPGGWFVSSSARGG
jgi:hypothetical protein